jgi:adenylate cyclase
VSTETTFKAAEEAGMKLAIRGRFVALVILGTTIVTTRAGGRTTDFLTLFAAFAVIGLVHHLMIGSRWDWPWVKYAIVTLNVAVICVAFSVGPLHETIDIAQYMVFRTDLFPLMFLFLGVSAFSFSPALILWAGCAISIGWLTVFSILTPDLSGALDWTDIRGVSSASEYLAVILDVKFIPRGSRMQEVSILMLTAAILAGVMHRARNTARAKFQAEEEREAVAQVFGQYVPAAVAERLVVDRGALDPVEREASVLFADLQGFTSMTEQLGPAATVAVLNEYFDAAARIVAKHRGVVTQFQGDAVVATFNVPIEIHDHASAAVAAGREIRELTDAREFKGIKLAAGVGIATGPLIAGSVGGGGRQTYTVHGDTVNLAARLEALNKELGTGIAVSERTRLAAQGSFEFLQVAQTGIRGQSGTARLFTLAEPGDA